jgi:MFS family permease
MAGGSRREIMTLAIAAAVSNTGSWAASVALSLVIYAKTGSAVWLATSFLLVQAPSALVTPLAGVIADRFDRRRVMITCDLLGAFSYAGLALTARPALLISLGAVAALVHSPFTPASRAAVPNLASGDELSWANGMLASAANVAQLAGPALGGVLFATAGAAAAFWVNSLSFVASAGLIAVVHASFRQQDSTSQWSGAGGTWAGVRFIWSDRIVLTLVAIGAVTFMATEIVTVADLPLIRHFQVGGVGYGIMNAAWGAGGLIGGLIAARVVNQRREPAAAVLGVLVFGLFVVAVGAAPSFVLVVVCTFAFALTDSFGFVGFSGIYQRRTPDEIRGRVFAAMGGITTLATAVSFGFAGFVVEATGWRPVYLGGGFVDMACGILLAVTLWRMLRDRAGSTDLAADPAPAAD